MKPKQRQKESLVRNFIFGVEDSLVSTVGLVSGIAVANVPKETIFLTGIILIFVEAFSMAVGTFLSESGAEEFVEGKSKLSNTKLITGSAVMFVSYLLAGIIPLFPYTFADTQNAFILSVGLSLFALFALGAVTAIAFKKKILSHGIKMLILGGVAIVVGIAVGKLIQN